MINPWWCNDDDDDVNDDDDDNDNGQVLPQVLAHRPDGRVPRNGVWSKALQEQEQELTGRVKRLEKS